jgi:SAM-dependent methyltransferase
VTSPAERWSRQLADWAIDPEILAAAPESPWGFPPEMFRADSSPGDGPTRQRVREALDSHRATVLDVGSGGGAASVPVLRPGVSAVAVDESAEMLADYAGAASATGAAVRTVQGSWPEVADEAGPAEVVVCANVVYNVPDIEPFVGALHRQAHRRVVIELTERHPLTLLGPLWKRFHGQDRPPGPTFGLFCDVLDRLGIEHRTALSERPSLFGLSDPEAYVAWTRRRLCLPVDRQPEVRALLAAQPPPPTRQAVTVWWDR